MKLELQMLLNGYAFTGFSGGSEFERILNDIADGVGEMTVPYPKEHFVFDCNGNICGYLRITEEDVK